MNRNTDVNNCQTWLEKLYRKNNMLMMVVLDNDQVLASFNSDYFLPQNSNTKLNNGSGVIMNLTNMKRYYLKKCFKGKGIKKDQKYFILGNN